MLPDSEAYQIYCIGPLEVLPPPRLLRGQGERVCSVRYQLIAVQRVLVSEARWVVAGSRAREMRYWVSESLWEWRCWSVKFADSTAWTRRVLAWSNALSAEC